MTPSAPPSLRVAPLALLTLISLAIVACAPLPDIGAATNTVPGPPPVLVPIGGILAQADAVSPAAAAVAPVNARAEQLRARAERLRRQ